MDACLRRLAPDSWQNSRRSTAHAARRLALDEIGNAAVVETGFGLARTASQVLHLPTALMDPEARPRRLRPRVRGHGGVSK